MNAMKKGSLDTLSLNDGFLSNTFSLFLTKLFASQQDYEFWYGDINKALEMKGDELEKSLHSNITHLNIEGCSIDPNISISEIKKSNNPKWPLLVKFFASDITHINISKGKNFNRKNIMELFATCIDNPVDIIKCSHLNLC